MDWVDWSDSLPLNEIAIHSSPMPLPKGFFSMKNNVQTEIHCTGCGTSYAGKECPICAPIDRMRRIARSRRRKTDYRRQCRHSFAELSQPNEAP